MSNAAKVTVVIPNYNGLKFMEPCFKALEMQLCRDFEILVVDNGSGDGSADEYFVELMNDKVRIFRSCQCGDQGVKNTLCDPFK